MNKVILGILAGGAAIFLLPLIGTLCGLFVGWAVGLFFADTVLGFLARIGVDVAGLTMWQVGAALGFLGTFFKTGVQYNAAKH